MTRIRLSTTVEKGGCSAKLGPEVLENILKQVPLPSHPDLIIGAETHDDAGVMKMPDGDYLIQTLDFFPPMVDDPFEFGQVAAANALSDVYAMGGKPISALSMVMFPTGDMPNEVLVEMLKGGSSKINESGALLLGGHTLDDSPLKFGLSVTGIVNKNNLLSNSDAKPGDVLVLTKPLGTAILTGASKVDMISQEDAKPAIESMTTLNKSIAEIMVDFPIKSATDITGFGLLGHSYKLAKESGVSIRIESKNLPALPKCLELLAKGAVPGGAIRNLNFVKPHTAFLPSLTNEQKWLAADPQTSGGLLISVPKVVIDDFMIAIEDKCIGKPAIVGEVMFEGKDRLLLA